ncbi:hypothetical protein [Dendronalium sp. ChiSLP03b]|uniref:hypothetical protein n=1 Tax=Dendronalium sp. ChiSLP03b TaxID=3075381 RepID=UPI002AD518D2|nr:hypothetical protein [Dendronalium sp. ChiSLP03b]MDZ8206763.1 hypothetical protein [Dendronalium sp. ChiSLP03b]
MDIDYRAISLIVSSLAALLGLLYQVLLGQSNQLKRELELLKLAKEAEANYLPLLRSVNSQIHKGYVHEELKLRKRVEIYLENLSSAILLSTFSFGLIGFIVSWTAQAIFKLKNEEFGSILASFAVLGLVVGIFGGFSDAETEIKVFKDEINKKIKETVEKDESEIKGSAESSIILNSANVTKTRSK